MSDIEKRLQSLSAEKLALLKRKLRTSQEFSGGCDIISRRENAGNAPLSFFQRSIWFFDQFEPGSAVYNRCANYRLQGPLNIEALQKALDTLVARHESLRTIFKMEGNEPVQVVLPECQVELPILDLSAQGGDDSTGRLQRLVSEEAQRPFNLTQGPLLRVTLIKLARHDHVLMTTIHHIISDGWSSAIFNRELGSLYNSITQGCTADLPDLPVQYVDYAQWQRERMQGEVLEKLLDYWRNQLEGAPPLLELPTDRPRPAIQTFRGGRRSAILPHALCDELTKLSQGEGGTLFMILLAAFQVLLYRYTGQEDIVVGTPIANRRRGEIEGLIGLFINVLALRCDLSGNPSFRDLAKRVREVALGAYDHQDMPFGKLVEELHPGRNLAYSPLFQVMFAYQNILVADLCMNGLDVENLEAEEGITHFYLTLIIENHDQGLKATLEYSADLFNASTMTRMLGHYQSLLEGIAADAGQGVAELPLLSEAERYQLLKQWNATEADYPRDKCLHELFEEQVERRPDAVAVVYESRSLTYDELNCRANQVARALRKEGVGPGALVAICLERSIEMVVGILGILKAGGGYVPLDPDYPEGRLAFMLEDTQVPVILVQQSLMGRLPEHDARVICLDAGWDGLDQYGQDNVVNYAGPDDLAYVIYTSGSTGKPKGVSVPHRAVNRLTVNTNYISLAETDRIAQVSSISFDAATFEIWGALLNGATLVGINKRTILSADQFSHRLEEDQISVLFLTTAVFNHLVGENPAMFACLDYLLFGGDSADPEKVRDVLKTAPPRHLINVYGPTENTTFSTWHEIRDLPDDAISVPIGRPISNTQVYILDGEMNPVPIGVYGELYLGGEGLALGYLNNHSLSSERFVPDPFNNLPGSRLYKTGDVARYREDGVIEFRGRMDNQVKIRGFRIEPGEIEAEIRQHPAVEEAIAVVFEETGGEKRLISYVTLKKPARITEEDLRSFLSERLPDYMRPAGYVILERFPLTENGKIDRQALPAPDMSMPLSTETYAAPRTKVEKDLVEIWESLFDRKKIGIHDDFFHLGGHSLLAARLFSILRNRYKRDLPLITIYESGTIEQIARLLTGDSCQALSLSSLAAVQSSGEKPPFFWGLGTRASDQARRFLGGEQPFYVLQHQAQDGYRARYTQIEALARWYLEDIRAVQPHGPYFLGGFSFGGMVAYEIARQIEQSGDSVALLFLLDATQPGQKVIKKEAVTQGCTRKLTISGRPGLVKGAWRRIRRVFLSNGIKEWAKLAVCHICFAMNIPMPVPLRSFYIIRIYKKAALGYRLVPLKGQVVFFQFEKPSGQLASNRYIECNHHAELYSMEGRHRDVVTPQHASTWANQLKKSLAAAQARVGYGGLKTN